MRRWTHRPGTPALPDGYLAGFASAGLVGGVGSLMLMVMLAPGTMWRSNASLVRIAP